MMFTSQGLMIRAVYPAPMYSSPFTSGKYSRHRLNSVVFVISNKVYAIEQSFVDICAFAKGGEFAPFDRLPSWDYPSVAKAFSVDGYTVQTGAELIQALDQICAQKHRPALVEVVIPAQDLAPAMAGLVKSITGKTVEQCPTCTG